jgi:hypothetical protein
MTNMENSKVILETVKGRLTVEDDLGLWENALTVLGEELLLRYDREGKNRGWVFLVGACSHWVRPHNSRWNAAGGFVFPEGYQNSLPQLEWSVILSYGNRCWTPVQKLPGKNNVVFRVFLPMRSARHKASCCAHQMVYQPKPNTLRLSEYRRHLEVCCGLG